MTEQKAETGNLNMEKLDVEKILAAGSPVQVRPQGDSMYPLLVSGRDWAIIEPVAGENCKRGNVVLYRRDGSILVLHRIWRKKADGFYMVGDGQTPVEGPLRPDQIRGIMTGMVRKGKQISVKNFPYRLYACIWLWLRPFRAGILRFFRKVNRLLKKCFKKNKND